MSVRLPDTKQKGTGGPLNRRQFLKRAAAVSGAVAVPYIVPASALGRGGAVAPSERIILGGIGIGRRGSHDLRWVIGEADVQFVASCDVWKERREAVKKTVDEKYGNKDCVLYRDIRQFLAERLYGGAAIGGRF